MIAFSLAVILCTAASELEPNMDRQFLFLDVVQWTMK